MQPVTVIINCGIGNVYSLKNTCLKTSKSVVVVCDPSGLQNLSVNRIILPGVGAVGPYLDMLRRKGLRMR